jgi:NADP-dependent 3-hydroxy acid dehydrogenase YdfG
MSLKGQIALVTGASHGIGRATAWRLAGAECDLVLLAQSEEELRSLAWEIKTAGREALPLVVDLRDEEQVQRALAQALAYFGRIDILVNNAGLWRYALVQDMSVGDWDEMFDVNLRGTFLCCKSLLPSMLARRRGHIVNIGSVSGLVGETEGSGYCATKWGLRGFTRSLLQEVGPKGIRVTLIEPGEVNNPGDTSPEAQAVIQNEDIADLVIAAVTLPERATLTEAVVWPSAEEYP